ncbi:MAG: trehalase [Flavobacteriaceae bacterium]|nr:trehalase [Flavobacteriaceae bacterium]
MIFTLDIASTLEQLLSQEDTDNDKKITIEDRGPGAFTLKAEDGSSHSLKGTYHLSNLLQELVIAMDEGKNIATIPIAHLEEPPVERVSRMIRDYFWKGLTRTMDASGIETLLKDSKNETLDEIAVLTVYVPHGDAMAFDYYSELRKELPLEIVRLPDDITPEYVRTLNDKPGILSLKLEEKNGTVTGVPFVVPGGRFNEMYGWDSYFESIGLILDGKVELAKAMADNFQYEIEHYGKILNANRSYYLTRTQPPFYSSLIAEVYEKTGDKSWLESHLKTAIKEYETVWMVPGKRLTGFGLNRYLAEGLGKPPEAEAGHFDHVFGKYAKEAGMSLANYENLYSEGKIENAELDLYFVHDRSVRESGHDTSYRLEGICADIIPVELNAFLYKYETDFAELIKNEFDDAFEYNKKTYSSQYWYHKAADRKERMDSLLWNDNQELFYDFNIETGAQTDFISATLFTPLWAGICDEKQAKSTVSKGISLLKEKGGIASCDEASRGEINEHRPQKQWDYPNGWAPHQMMIWKGLKDYGYHDELQELVYRWMYMITRNAVDYNGTIPEKYDVVVATHKVFAEYGNVGTEFQYITKEGFGWMNASFQYGISLMEEQFIKKLNELVPPEELF